MMQDKQDATFTFVFKPSLLFFIAYVFNTTLHDLVHTVVAFAYGIEANLFHYYVHNEKASGSAEIQSAIALSGPMISLAAGLAFLGLYRKAARPGMRLFLLYAATIGIGIFFGNMFSATFDGDLNRVATLLRFSPAIRYIISFLGLVFSILFMWRMGKEFLQFAVPESHSRIKGIVYTILIPWLGGIVLVALAYWPLPSFLVTAMVASSVFWVFTVIGSLTSKFSGAPRQLLTATNWIDLSCFLLAMTVVRMLIYKISFFHG